MSCVSKPDARANRRKARGEQGESNEEKRRITTWDMAIVIVLYLILERKDGILFKIRRVTRIVFTTMNSKTTK